MWHAAAQIVSEGALADAVTLLHIVCAEVNEAAILVMITIGLYQAACNIWRVFTFDTESLPAKVGCMTSRPPARKAVCGVSFVGANCQKP